MNNTVTNGNFKVFNKEILKVSQAVELKIHGIVVHGIVKRVSLESTEIFIYSDEDDRMMTLLVKIYQMKSDSKNGVEIRVLS